MTQTVAVDFDGVIHAYSKGWQDGSIYDGPVDGAFDALRSLMERYAVCVFTTRGPLPVAAWLHEQGGFDCTPDPGGIEFWNERGPLLITQRKLPAVAYIDDRAIRFRSWEQALADLADPGRHTVYVSLAGTEPVASFIAKATRAFSFHAKLTVDEATALPDNAVRAWAMLGDALSELGVTR